MVLLFVTSKMNPFTGHGAGVTAKATTTVVASWASQSDPLVGYRILGAGQRIAAITLFSAAKANRVSGDVQAHTVPG